MQIENVADFRLRTGENVVWHPLEKRVYWTDIPTGTLYRYDPATNYTEQVYQHNTQVGGLTIQADGGLLLLMERGAFGLWRDGKFTLLCEEIAAIRDTRFNDAIADSRGRVFSGTMRPKIGGGSAKLLRLDPDGSVHVVLDNVGQSNGMGFTPDGKRFYHIDTERHRVNIYDYDESTGTIINERPLLDVPEQYGWPDGMVVDADGALWIAFYDGGHLLRYTPEGALDKRIEMPARNITCPAFGGDDLSDLYVTSAVGDEYDPRDPQAGSLFRLRGAGRGVPQYYSRIGLT